MKRLLSWMVVAIVVFSPSVALARGGHGEEGDVGGHVFSGGHAVAGGTPISGPFAIILIIVVAIVAIIVKIIKQSDD